VLSWSMMDAMSCGAVVLGSDTAPVREMIKGGENGLLADFFSPEAIAAKAVEVLRDPDAARPMGRAAEKMIVERYSLEAVIPEMIAMYEQTAAMKPTLPTWPLPPVSNQPPAVPVTPARQGGGAQQQPQQPPPQQQARPAPAQQAKAPKNPSPFRG